jgi:hypothetical protein
MITQISVNRNQNAFISGDSNFIRYELATLFVTDSYSQVLVTGNKIFPTHLMYKLNQQCSVEITPLLKHLSDPILQANSTKLQSEMGITVSFDQ